MEWGSGAGSPPAPQLTQGGQEGPGATAPTCCCLLAWCHSFSSKTQAGFQLGVRAIIPRTSKQQAVFYVKINKQMHVDRS